MRIRASLLFLVCASELSALAAEASELRANGSPLETSRYAIDLYQTAVWAGSRVTSLGGSYVALAYDVDGMLQNPAAPAVRPYFSVTDFDYWLGFGATIPSSLSGMDFFNSGKKTLQDDAGPDSLLYLTPAAILQFGNLGVGVNVELQRYGLTGRKDADGQDLSVAFHQAHIQCAYSFLQSELIVGGGLRLLEMEAQVGSGFGQRVPFSADGLGAELGVLYQPRDQYFSVGAAFRTDITATAELSEELDLNASGDLVYQTPSGPIFLPESAQLPWDLHLGVVYNFGGAPPNLPWRSEATVARRQLLDLDLEAAVIETDYERRIAVAESRSARAALEQERDGKLETIEKRRAEAKTTAYWQIQDELSRRSRSFATLTASVLIAGTVENAVGVESLRDQTVNRSGEWVVASPRLGSEVEALPDWIRLRSGVYLEPTRFSTSKERPHYTAGLDLALGVWSVFGLWPSDYRWRAAVSADIARDFQTIGVSLAGWYPRHRGMAVRPRK